MSRRILPLSGFLNRFLGRLPVLDAFSLMFAIVARPAPHRFPGARGASPSVSVVIPCRNESGHVPDLVARLPALAPGSEFLFVEGHSKDDTEDALRREIAAHPDRPFRLLKQNGIGKGDAVRRGFAEARGEVLLILDADLGVAPEEIPKFVRALVAGKGELINGSRMIYPMEGRAMRFLNLIANKAFAYLFAWLLGQQVRDTLCGTKALYREDYERIAANRAFFGEFDPFGDFDLLFGAARLNLRIVDVAVRYHERRTARRTSPASSRVAAPAHGAFAARKLVPVRRLRSSGRSSGGTSRRGGARRRRRPGIPAQGRRASPRAAKNPLRVREQAPLDERHEKPAHGVRGDRVRPPTISGKPTGGGPPDRSPGRSRQGTGSTSRRSRSRSSASRCA